MANNLAGTDAAGSPWSVGQLKLKEVLATDLAQVESILRREMSSRYHAVDEIISYGCLLGGKRLRPALLLLCGQAWGPLSETHYTLAAVLEMIHTATLIHDDVLDGANTRRHHPSMHVRWDTERSILAGDYLFSQAFFMASTAPTTFAAQRIGRATNQVCEGELRQIATKGNFTLDEREYFSIIEGKTAVLCQCACELGAVYAGAPELATQQAAEFGRCLGIAFQIVDDLLDIQGVDDVTGKTLGTDLRQGKPTLPVIHALAMLDRIHRQKLLDLLSAPQPPTAEIRELLTLSGSFAYTRGKAESYLRSAVTAVSRWQPSAARSSLLDLSDFVLRRYH